MVSATVSGAALRQITSKRLLPARISTPYIVHPDPSSATAIAIATETNII
jgi:hypothetical protein